MVRQAYGTLDPIIGQIDHDLLDPNQFGKGFATTGLPSYAIGIERVPYDQIAQIHAGERVVTKDDNESLSTVAPLLRQMVDLMKQGATLILNLDGNEIARGVATPLFKMTRDEGFQLVATR